MGPMIRIAISCIFLTSAAADDSSHELANDTKQQAAKHWSFTVPQRPAIPSIRDQGWARNPIDHFVLAKLEAQNWRPAPAALSHHLLRRMYLDLTGLPASVDRQQHFTKQDSTQSFDRLVDQLLASPGYGERWGRHWLDLVRYGDTNGYEKDFLKPLVYQYRDYVIQALNMDKTYDRFVLEQLAGDEIPYANSESMIATGYYRVGPWDAERGANIFKKERDEERAAQLDDMVKTTGQVFLGLTLGCARCHDHKYDPITAQEYYSLVSIFNPLKRSQKERHPFTLPAASPAQLKAKETAGDRIAELIEQIATYRTAHEQQAASVPTITPAENSSAEPRKLTKTKNLEKQLASWERELNWLKELAAVEEFPQGYFMYEDSPEAPPTYLMVRGSIHNRGPEVQPAVPAALVNKQPKFLSPDEFTSRRRLSLATWIIHPDNPLTARVIVNRVWQFHFGEALVRTPSDFGSQGEKPTHPELLDWLASWFIKEGNWSLKKLHRLIMCSNTYRMSQQGNPQYREQDPDNRLLHRFPRRRLEVEIIRDSMLAVSGQLNHKKYGPAMYPFLSATDREGHFRPEIELTDWHTFNEVEASRRTIYACLQRSLVLPILEVMDFCDTTQSVDQRPVTTVAPQALMLFNGEFTNRQSRHFAQRLKREAGDEPQSQITLAYRLALSRPPTDSEQTMLFNFLKRDTEKQIQETTDQGEIIAPELARRRSLEQVCRLIFNLNEFVYPD